MRESATSLTSGSQKPIGSHLLPQPPCWFGELRRTSPPSLRLLFHAKCRRKKKCGEPMPGASGYRVLAGPRGRRAATGASVRLPYAGGAAGPPRSSRSLAGEHCGARPSALSPLTGLRRDPRASAAFPQRCGSVVDAAPPVFGGASCWRRNSLQPRWKPQTAARASWSARTHEAGFVSFCAVSYVFLE